MPAARKALIVFASFSVRTSLAKFFKGCFLIFLFLVLSFFLKVMSFPVTLAGQSSEFYNSAAQSNLSLTIKVDESRYYLRDGDGWAPIEDGTMPGGSSVPVLFFNGRAGEEYVFLKL